MAFFAEEDTRGSRYSGSVIRERHDLVVVEEAPSKHEGIGREEGRRQAFYAPRGCRRFLVVGDVVDVRASR